jgi:hypothetical protein
VRMGDWMLWTWGEQRRNGMLQAAFDASVAAIREGGSARAPGTHSDPTLARLLAADDGRVDAERKLTVALRVECEMAIWARDPKTKNWVRVAEAYYAAPHPRTNAEVGRRLNLSQRAVELARREMRRYLVVALRRTS